MGNSTNGYINKLVENFQFLANCRELTEQEESQIASLLKPAIDESNAICLTYLLSARLKFAGVCSESAEHVIKLLLGDGDLANAGVSALRTVYGLEKQGTDVSEICGYRTFTSVVSDRLSPQEAHRIVMQLSNLLGLSVNEPHTLEEKLTFTLKSTLNSGKPNVALIAAKIVSYLIQKHHVIVPVANDNELGVFCYRDGYYRECEKELEAELVQVYAELEIEKTGVKYKSLHTETFSQLRDAAKIFKDFDSHLLLFRNGVFDWRSFVKNDSPELREPSPELLVLHRIPWELDIALMRKYAGAKREELPNVAEQELGELAQVFKQWVGEKWFLLVEIIGYTLLAGDYPLNKAVMLVGEGKNGKSSYLGLIRKLLGSENVVDVKLQELTDDGMRFIAGALYKKLANIYADLPKAALSETGTFKVLTGQDPITVDRKFRDPITFVNYAKLLFSANELPVVYDTTTAFWRRWLVIEFPNTFAPNEAFKQKLYGELLPQYAAKLLALGLLAAKHVILSGKFTCEETEADYKDKWLRESNNVYAFISDMLTKGYLIKDAAAKIETGDLYNLYAKYCECEELEAWPQRKFTMEMQRLGYKRVKSHGERYFVGLKLNPNRAYVCGEGSEGEKSDEEEVARDPELKRLISVLKLEGCKTLLELYAHGFADETIEKAIKSRKVLRDNSESTTKFCKA